MVGEIAIETTGDDERGMGPTSKHPFVPRHIIHFSMMPLVNLYDSRVSLYLESTKPKSTMVKIIAMILHKLYGESAETFLLC